jgi:predicted small lipoprotein YifL
MKTLLLWLAVVVAVALLAGCTFNEALTFADSAARSYYRTPPASHPPPEPAPEY